MPRAACCYVYVCDVCVPIVVSRLCLFLQEGTQYKSRVFQAPQSLVQGECQGTGNNTHVQYMVHVHVHVVIWNGGRLEGGML